MFSGIVEGKGKVIHHLSQAGGVEFVVDLGHFSKDLKPGDSVAINGVCLTVAKIEEHHISFNVISETLRKTNLGSVQQGSSLNSERSMRIGDRLEGHMVQGHVQGLATVVQRIANDQDFKLVFAPPTELMVYLAPLSSVAVNGVSLTIADVSADTFTVALIPTTLERTNLGELQEGDVANLETDIIARQIVHYLKALQLPKLNN